jgi:hypothetical protein
MKFKSSARLGFVKEPPLTTDFLNSPDFSNKALNPQTGNIIAPPASVPPIKMRDLIRRGYLKALFGFSLPILLAEYFAPATGDDYQMEFWRKLNLAKQLRRNGRALPGTLYIEHLILATKILQIPPEHEGCIVECGTWEGCSTTSLSLIAAITGRDLEVFDSFSGLPEPAGNDGIALSPDRRDGEWSEGDYAGQLEMVKQNVETYGALPVCTFHEGYFEETMPEFDESVAFAFLDVDLLDSYRTAVKHLWPLLSEGSYLFIHEAKHRNISHFFFDQEWWSSELSTDPPGLVGAGTGLGYIPRANGWEGYLGYTVKGSG